MDIFWLVMLFILGACIGSFLNVIIWRLPRGESIVFPGSHCPRCGRPIRWHDNIPILSWLLLRGRCRDCKAKISPRYLAVEFTTAVLVAGLYAGYFLLDLRDGAGKFADAWPMYAAHAALLCGLLACSLVDVEMWIIPLEIMWVCSIIGVAAATADPHPFLPMVSPTLVAMSFAAAVGLVIALLLVRANLIQPSFLDAEEPPPPDRSARGKQKPKPPSVAITTEHGVNPRREILRELLFLAPPFAMAIAAWLVLRYVPGAGQAWAGLLDSTRHPQLAPRLTGCGSAVFGYLIGGLWIWGIRILGTLGFGKEAMGLGDVHILAGVGAVTGWFVPSVAFFVAPFLGLLWALSAWIGKGQRELPYGPWLALASGVVMIFHDLFAELVAPYRETLAFFAGR